MRHLAAVALFVVASGCKEWGAEGAGRQSAASIAAPDDPDIMVASQRAEQVDVVAITTAEYLAIVSRGDFGATTESARDLQLQLSAAANDADALGVVGEVKADVSLKGRRVVVLHNERPVDGLRYQATSISVVSGELRATASFALVNVQLHFSAKSQASCMRPFRGCSSVLSSGRPQAFANWEFGGMGLPPDIRIDGESPERPKNATGRSIELWTLPNTDVSSRLWADGDFIGHRFVCVNPLREDAAAECDRASPIEETVWLVEKPAVELGESVVLVSEADFQSALLKGGFAEVTPREDTVARALMIASALNRQSSKGVRARISNQDTVVADVLLVAKALSINGELVGGQRVFVVPGPVKIELSGGLAGLSPVLPGIDIGQFSAGVCGPEMYPGFKPDLEFMPTLSDHGGYGTDRFLSGLPRSTIRFPVRFQGRQTVQVLACSHFEPPIPPPPNIGPVVSFKTEACNGLDDTGDGQVDEKACDLTTCSVCVPISSCNGRCASVPDGCGGVISCPCP